MSTGGTPVLLSLGSNVGDCVSNIRTAVALLQSMGALTDAMFSRWYQTEPVGYTDQPMFVNIAVTGRTTLSPTELVRACKAVEQEVGRTSTAQWREREIDVDVILVGDAVVNSDGICIPHPRMHERMFVLRPACDVAPAMVHPLFGTTMMHLLDTCADTAAVDVFDPDTP